MEFTSSRVSSSSSKALVKSNDRKPRTTASARPVRNVDRIQKGIEDKKETEIIVVKRAHGSGDRLIEEWDIRATYVEWDVICNSGLGLERRKSLCMSNLLKEIPLERNAIFVTNNIHLQITAPRIRTPRQKGVYLSSTLLTSDEDVMSISSRSSQLSWSSYFQPCVKNVYCIRSTNLKRRNGVKLLYGDGFYITTLPDSDQKILYVGAKSKVLRVKENDSKHFPITFFPDPTGACIWKAMAAKPEEREHKSGKPIHLDDYIHVMNVLLGRKLSIEPMHKHNTLFGKEYQATAYNHIKTTAKGCSENCLAFTINITTPTESTLDSEGQSSNIDQAPSSRKN